MLKVEPEILRIPVYCPTTYIAALLSRWTLNKNYISLLFKEADIALLDFLLDDASLYYGKMTIAVCALITAFSKLQLKCIHFLRTTVPDDIFVSGNHEIVVENIKEFDSCIKIFNKNNNIRNRKLNEYLKGDEWYSSFLETQIDNTTIEEHYKEWQFKFEDYCRRKGRKLTFQDDVDIDEACTDIMYYAILLKFLKLLSTLR